MAKEDSRQMPYTASCVYMALRAYRRGERDEDGERDDFVPATNRKQRKISLGGGIGVILFRDW